VSKMIWDKQERRRHKRYGFKDCTVQYKAAPFLGLEFLGNISERYLVLNISQGGLHFIAKEKLKEHSRIALKITAPLLKEEKIRVKGHVAWVKESTDARAYHVGIEFGSLSKLNRNKLRSLLDNAVLDKIDLSTQIYLKEVEKL